MVLSRSKLMISAGVTLVASLAAWRWWSRSVDTADSVQVIDNSRETRDLLRERAPAAGQPIGSSEGIATTEIVLGGEAMPPEDAKRLFHFDGERLVYDPFTFFRYQGGLKEEVRWLEHPDGRFERRTSREGFREDFDHLPEKRDCLVVVAGDSQTDGLCSNAESFSNLAQAKLSALHPGSAIEVLNTGVCGYSFYNYLGTLQKLADSKPDAFVVAFYSGNDFKDLIVPWHYFHRSSPPPARPEYTKKLKEATRISGSATAMALNRILYFKYEPEEARTALRAAVEVCTEIQRLCSERGIALLFIHIPPYFNARGKLPPAIASAKEKLGLSDEEIAIQDSMPDDLIGTLRASGADVLDLREHFGEDISSYYWSDMHLNLKGHGFVAECLVPKLEAACAGRLRSAEGSPKR